MLPYEYRKNYIDDMQFALLKDKEGYILSGTFEDFTLKSLKSLMTPTA